MVCLQQHDLGGLGPELRDVMWGTDQIGFSGLLRGMEFDLDSGSHGRVFSTEDPCFYQRPEAQVKQFASPSMPHTGRYQLDLGELCEKPGHSRACLLLHLP